MSTSHSLRGLRMIHRTRGIVTCLWDSPHDGFMLVRCFTGTSAEAYVPIDELSAVDPDDDAALAIAQCPVVTTYDDYARLPIGSIIAGDDDTHMLTKTTMTTFRNDIGVAIDIAYLCDHPRTIYRFAELTHTQPKETTHG